MSKENPQVARLQAGLHERMVVFASREGAIVHIKEVPNGYRCGAVCLACGGPLNARNGGAGGQRAHFAHRPGQVCREAAERSIHDAAAKIIQESGWIQVPALSIYVSAYAADGEPLSVRRIRPKRTVEFQGAVLELRDYLEEFGFQPDVVANVLGWELAIEVRFTHPVDTEKAKRVAAAKLPMIEVDISRITMAHLDDRERFASFVLAEAPRRWIYHPLEADLRMKAKAELDQRLAEIAAERAAQEEAVWASQLAQEEEREQERLKREQEALRRAREAAQQEARRQELRARAAAVFQNKEREAAQLAAAQKVAWHALNAVGLAGSELPEYVNVTIPNDWIIPAHRIAWQGVVFAQYVASAPHQGHPIVVSEVASMVEARFGLEPLARELLAEFSDSRFPYYLEASLGPYCGDLRVTLVAYFESLANHGLVSGERGAYQVLFRSIQEMEDARAEALRQALEQEERQKQERAARFARLCQLRLEEMLTLERELLKRAGGASGLAQIMRCRACLLPTNAMHCPYCGSLGVERDLLDANDIATGLARYSGPEFYKIEQSVRRLPGQPRNIFER